MINPVGIGFLQALGVVSYIALVALFIQNGENIVGPLNNFLGPIIMLTLLSVSVLSCGFLALGYPIHLFWIKKKPAEALSIVGYTTLFLLIFFLAILAIVATA